MSGGLPAQAGEATRRPTGRGEAVWRRPLAIALALAVLLFLVAPPWPPVERFSWVGYAVCHQIPSRSFHPGGHQLPLCSRCSGTFIGACLGLVYHFALDRRRSSEMPPPWVLTFAVICILAFGVDGLNSYLSFFPGVPHLYQPHNLLRLITGTFNGLALSIIVYPVLNLTLWRSPAPFSAIREPRHLAPLVAMGLALIVVIYSEPASLYYPLAILSALAVIVLLCTINTMIALIVLRREGQAERWMDAILPVAAGLFLTLLEMAAIDFLRLHATGLLPLQGLIKER